MPEFRPPRTPLVPPGHIEIFTRDMTATFSADLRLSEAQKELAQVDQWIPIDGDPSAPLGHLVEQNSTGPLRLGYGAWRDLLLGCQFHNTAGDLITAGGRVVKNVAGYDLTKLMIGQRGLFGRLVTLTARTYRRPAGALLARFPADARIVTQLLTTTLRPQWAILTSDELLCGYIGSSSEIDYWQSKLDTAARPLQWEKRSIDQDIEHRAALFRWPDAHRSAFRASVPPARLGHLAGVLEVSWAADAAFGIIVGHATDEAACQRITQAVHAAGGTIVFNDCRVFSPAENWDGSGFSAPGPGLAQLLNCLQRAFAESSSSAGAIQSGGDQ